MLEGHRHGEGVLFVNFQENPAQVKRMIRGLGTDPERAYATGFYHIYTSPVELQIDSVIDEIFSFIETARVRRVVVDAVGDLAEGASDPQRLHDFLYSLVQHFVVRNVTSILNLESAQGVAGGRDEEQRWSYMSDNVLLMERSAGGDGERTIRVVKTRNSSHDPRPHRMEIRRDGVHVI